MCNKCIAERGIEHRRRQTGILDKRREISADLFYMINVYKFRLSYSITAAIFQNFISSQTWLIYLN